MTARIGRVTLSAVALALFAATPAMASSHREAPFITRNPKVDATDFYMFRSYEATRDTFVTLVANYVPLQSQYGGPNFFTMDPEALYEIHIDNNGDAVEDLTFQFRFQTTLANAGNGLALDIGATGAKKSVAVPFFNIGALTAGDESARNVMETYSLKLVTGPRRTGTAADVTQPGGATSFKKPADNIGAKSIAAYSAYANAHIFPINIPGCATPGKVFVGQRAESFAVNLGVVFDLVNAPLAVIGDAANRNAAPNPLSKNNITSLALELPISCVKSASSDVIGGWTTASVRQARVVNPGPTFSKPSVEGGAWTQVSRLSMPLVNELVIGIKDKDKFNASEPKNDTQFIDYVTHPTLATVIEILYGAANAPAPTAYPRNDLVAVFLTGVEGVNKTATPAEYQRLNVTLPATPKAGQNNLGAAACFPNRSLVPNTSAGGCDVGGFPNGRRPGDDVTDVALRVMMGYLMPAGSAAAGSVPLHDAVLQDASQFGDTFPYLAAPNGGT